jgi:hypothetical protein
VQGPVPYVPKGFTKWDKIVIREGDITLRRFLDIFKDTHGVEVDLVGSSLASALGLTKVRPSCPCSTCLGTP